MINFIGRHCIYKAKTAIQFFDLLIKTISYMVVPPYRIKDLIRQLYFVMNESFSIVAICVTAAAVVTIIEASFHMKLVVKNDSMVPGFAALIILRELGAVVTGLLITSRVGAGLAAEVGSMKVTEQIDAYKMLGLNPIRFLVVPRFLACVIGVAILTIIANVICLVVAMLVSDYQLGYGQNLFLSSMRNFVDFKDLIFAGVKGAVFGSVIPLVSCYYGFRCEAGAEGVGQATTKSVVTSSVLIIILDFLLSWFFSNFY